MSKILKWAGILALLSLPILLLAKKKKSESGTEESEDGGNIFAEELEEQPR